MEAEELARAVESAPMVALARVVVSGPEAAWGLGEGSGLAAQGARAWVLASVLLQANR